MKIKDAKYFGIKLSPHRIKNDKGQLIITGCEFARTGKQKYHSSELTEEGEEDKLNKFIYLDRPVEEVSDSKTVASFEGAPVTLDHPKDDVKVGVNWSNLAKGFATNVKYIADSDKEGHLQADFIFTDADLIKKIENHEIEELSAGYNCEVDEKDWVQRHIRGNHIAVVAQARAGHQARLLDNAYKSTSKSLKTLKLGDKVVEIADSYSYVLEYGKDKKVRCTDYYTYGKSGKKEFVCTLKDEDKSVKDEDKAVKDNLVGKVFIEESSKDYDWNTELEYELNKKYFPEGWYTKEQYEDALEKMKKEAKDDYKTWYSISQYLPFNSLVKEPGVNYQILEDCDIFKDSKQVKDSEDEYFVVELENMSKPDEKLYAETYGLKSKRKGNTVLMYGDEDTIRNMLEDYVGQYSKIGEIMSKGMYVTNVNFQDEVNPIFEKCKAIDDKLRKLFNKPYFEVEGFMNGNDSDEGSIYVVDYSIRKDKDKPFSRGDFDDYDDYLQEACNYLERKYEAILGDDPDIESIDIDVCDWDHSEDWNIDFHIYCKGVTR